MVDRAGRGRWARPVVLLAGSAAAVGLVLVMAGAAEGGNREFPVQQDIALPVPADGSSGGPPVVPVPDQPTFDRPDLTALGGVLDRCGSEYCVNGTGVDFGPPWHLERAEAPADLDRDGRIGTFAEEIAGLAGRTVTLTVEYGRTGVPDVFAVDGVFLRAEIGPPGWAGGPPWAGPPR